jgi:hypothetical protein
LAIGFVSATLEPKYLTEQQSSLKACTAFYRGKGQPLRQGKVETLAGDPGRP